MPALWSTDNTTNNAEVGAGASYASLTAATIMFWARATAINNVTRNICGSQRWEIFRRAADGSQLRLSVNRATSAQTITSGVGMIVANEDAFWVISYDTGTSSNADLWKGTKTKPIALDTNAITGAGSGSVTAMTTMRLFSNVTPTLSWNGPIYAFGIWNRVGITLAEMRDLQYDFRPTEGCVGFWRPGENGTGLILDESGFSNHGVIAHGTGSLYLLANDPTAPWQPRLWYPDVDANAVAAAGRTTKNTRAWPLGVNVGMNWRAA